MAPARDKNRRNEYRREYWQTHEERRERDKLIAQARRQATAAVLANHDEEFQELFRKFKDEYGIQDRLGGRPPLQGISDADGNFVRCRHEGCNKFAITIIGYDSPNHSKEFFGTTHECCFDHPETT